MFEQKHADHSLIKLQNLVAKQREWDRSQGPDEHDYDLRLLRKTY